MRPTIFETMQRLRPLPLNHQARFLRNLIEQEKPRSLRRADLIAALRQVVMRDLKAGNRGIRRAS